MSYLNNAPYYDRYDEDGHKEKGYTRVLTKPGLAEQASEFNEVQSIARDYLSRLGNSLYRNGQIINGCGISIDGDDITIAKGQIFMNGLIRDTDEVHLHMTGIGTERIVVTLITSVVTASQDDSLLDDQQGSENYGQEGADREKEEVVFAIVDSETSTDGYEIYKLEEGKIPEEVVNDGTEDYVTDDQLAVRTFDENGSYKIRGITIKDRVEDVSTTKKIKVYVTDGKASVSGYDVSRSAMSHVLLDQSTDTRTVTSESHYYNSLYKKYELSNGPVARVTNLTCLVSVIGERKFRGSVTGGYDQLNHTPVDSITRVYTLVDGEVDHTYVQNVDYKLYNDQIDWSLTGDDAQEPSKGTTYYVDYVYNKTMVADVDYTIENSASTAYLRFLDGGDKPDENSRMYISYLYTLARRDLLLLDSDGSIRVIKGQPDKLANLITPYNGDNRVLELGYVSVYPTDALSGKVIDGIADVVNYNSVRLTQQDFYSMYQRLNRAEDALAELDMEREIEDGEDIASLNGYFTDSFNNFNRSDLSYTTTDNGEDIQYDACLDLSRSELTIGEDIKNTDMIISLSDSDDFATFGTVISAPYDEEVCVRQKFVTGAMLVNPYASYGPLCQVKLDPAVDNWIDEKETTIYNTENNVTYAYSTVVSSRTITMGGHFDRYLYSTSTSTQTVKAGTSISKKSSTSVSETVKEYMRVKDVNIEGRAFSNGMKDIRCYFNGNPIDLKPVGSTVAGNKVVVGGKTVKTVNADSLGRVNAKFTVPKNTPCGKVNVVLEGVDSVNDTYSGSAVYSAVGTLRTTTITNTNVITDRYNVITTTINTYAVDPLAQSFMMSPTYDRVLSKIGLYFATRADDRPVVVQVRNMVNGYPGDIVYAEVELEHDEVNVPTDPKVPVVTNIVLNQPVLCKANTYYCFCILSDSNKYSMFYAHMGDNILGTKNEQMVVNPYATGVMFSSSNSSTWTAHQDADLKFELYRSVYKGNGEIIFDEATVSEVTGIFLDAAYQDTTNSGITWFYKYKLNDGTYSIWYPIDTLTFRDLQAVTNKVVLKAEFKTNFSTSPYLDSSRVSLRSFVGQHIAHYFGQHITEDMFEEPYQSLKISYLAAMPTGTSHEVYYMDIENGDWVLLDENNPNVDLDIKRYDEEFMKYTWTVDKIDCMEKDIRSVGSKFFKSRIDLTTSLAYNKPRIKKLACIFKYN